MPIAEADPVDNVRGKSQEPLDRDLPGTNILVVLGQDPLIPPALLQSEIPSVSHG